MTRAAEQVESARPQQPRRMLDRYELLAEIARGGMGTVYLARLGGAGGFERLFAIKLMHEHLAEDETFVTMLLDEARTAAHIHHPKAVGIIDVRESEVGYYLVMNYVDGFALSQILDHPELDADTRIRIGARLVADAAQGLHAAHTAKSPQGQRLGIVHRDVSPQNILVGTDGTGRIVDFGIALAASRIAASRPGMLKGKPSYMAPEQACGEPCDARADVFALGIVLWEALTGERLFYADMDLATLVKVMECVVEPPTKHVPALPDALSAVTMKALQKDPAARFATARDFGVAIERAAEAAGLLASANEIEEVLERLFEEDMATRQEAVRLRLANASGREQPLDRAGLASISRLVPRARRDGASAVSEMLPGAEDDLPATRASRPGGEVRSGVRESATPRTPTHAPSAPEIERSAPAIDPHAGTRLRDRPGAKGTTPSAVAARAPASSRAPLAIAVVVALLAVGVAAWLLAAGGTPSETDTAALDAPTAPAPPRLPEPAAVAAPEPAAVAAPEPAAVAAPEPAAELERAAVAAPEPAAELEPAGPIADEPAVVEAARVLEAAPAPTLRPARPRREPAPPPVDDDRGTGSRSPVVETNPYLTH